MLRYLFTFLIFIHALIHVLGFAKAFGMANIPQLTKNITSVAGAFWLATFVLFLVAAIFFLVKNNNWTIIVFFAIVLSEVLIFTEWKDAKWGMVVNFIILIVAVASLASGHFESVFKKDVRSLLQNSTARKTELLTKTDIRHLPLSVQKYIRYSGAMNQPKVRNVRIQLHGEMRSRKQDWFPFEAVQHNFLDNPVRLFFMKATMFGIAVPGYHKYQNETATMNVKLFGLIPVMQASGREMDVAETVTVFNDMCLMAPGALIDKRIHWEMMDDSTVKATFINGKNSISATLYFNQQGQLINFQSDDRYDIADMKQYRFSTPVKEYQILNGRNIISFGEGVWHYPEGEFVYGKFYIRDIKYNVEVVE